MAFIPQNFVNQGTIPVGASWLNSLDVFANSVFAGAQTVQAALNALYPPNGVTTIALGGTNATTAPTALANLGGTTLSAAVAASTAALTQAIIMGLLQQTGVGQLLYPVVPGGPEALAGVTVINYAYPPGWVDRYGNNAIPGTTDMTAAINAAIAVAGQVVGTQQGGAIYLLNSTYMISSNIVLPNRVRVIGQNKRGTVIIASPSWNNGSYPQMFYAVGGTWSGGVYTPAAGSMFDSTLENLTVNCNNVVSIGVLSYAWQDGCGPRGVLVQNFIVSGFKFVNGWSGGNTGGADTCRFMDVEIVNGTVSASAMGIDLSTPIGSVGAFKLDLYDVVIVGSATQNLAQGIWSVGNSIAARATHFESCTSSFYLDGIGFHSLDDCDGTTTTTTLTTLVSTYTGTLIMKNCRRNAATNYLVDNRASGYGTITGTDHPLMIINGDTTESAKGLAFCSAWVVFEGSSAAIDASYNVTSVTRNSAGNYSISLTRPMQFSSAAVSVVCNASTSGVQYRAQNSSVSTINVFVEVAGTPTDEPEIKVIIFGG